MFKKEDRKRAEFLNRIAEGELRYVSYMIGFISSENKEKIIIYIAPNTKSMCEYISASECEIEEWVAGFAIPSKNTIVVSIKGNIVFSLEDTFIHELSHLILEQAINFNSVPKWFNEGFAMYTAKEPLVDRIERVLSANVFKRLMPLSDLEKSFPSSIPAVHLAYSQSLMFVRFMVKEKGRENLISLIKMVKNGMLFDNAFESIYGKKVSEMEKEFIKSLSRISYVFYIITGSGSLWVLMTLLFIISYIRRKKKNRKRLTAWWIQEELEKLENDENNVN